MLCGQFAFLIPYFGQVEWLDFHKVKLTHYKLCHIELYKKITNK